MTARARTRSMVLDGHSFKAATEQTADRLTAIQGAIVECFEQLGPGLTDDALIDAYEELRRADPDIPRAAPSSIRSRRSELSRRGLLVATKLPGRSRYGRPATVHILASDVPSAERLLVETTSPSASTSTGSL